MLVQLLPSCCCCGGLQHSVSMHAQQQTEVIIAGTRGSTHKTHRCWCGLHDQVLLLLLQQLQDTPATAAAACMPRKCSRSSRPQ